MLATYILGKVKSEVKLPNVFNMLWNIFPSGDSVTMMGSREKTVQKQSNRNWRNQ